MPLLCAAKHTAQNLKPVERMDVEPVPVNFTGKLSILVVKPAIRLPHFPEIVRPHPWPPCCPLAGSLFSFFLLFLPSLPCGSACGLRRSPGHYSCKFLKRREIFSLSVERFLLTCTGRGVFSPWPNWNEKEVQMKTIYQDLSSIIMDLEAIRENLESLRRGMELALPRSPFENCLIILLASQRIREAIEILGRMKKETGSVTSTT